MKNSVKYFSTVVIISVLFLGVDCKDDPIPPCTDCPQPLDTTSHDFVWTIDTLGDASSQLNDVAIINDTTVICVGRMYLNDSNGQINNSPYSIAKWNGKEWNLKKIYSADNLLIADTRGILAFAPSDIWLTDGAVNHWDGLSLKTSVTFDRISLIGGEENGQSVNKLWGTNSNDLYGVGWKGMITHYNGTTWQKIESGTALDIQDIWGSTDPKTGEQQILAVASNKFLNEGKKLLQINNTTATAVADSGLPWSLSSVWFEANQQYYIVGDGVYPEKKLSSIWKRDETLPPISKNSIRANNRNDIAIAGAFGLLLHYNGSTWKNYMGNELPEIGGSYYSVAIKNNLVVAVGHIGDRAIVVMGKRK
jgi:hypothetical protein